MRAFLLLLLTLPRSRGGGSTSKRNFIPCCELVQEIGGSLDYNSDPRFAEHRCVSVMKDLGPCFSACKEMHHGKVVEEMDSTEEENSVHHQYVLLISHQSTTDDHGRESEQAICSNLMSRHIARVIMLFEGTDTGCRQMQLRFPARKLNCRSLPTTPSYRHLFTAASHLSKGAIAIVALSDVVFDDSLRTLWPDALRNTPTVMAISVQPPVGAGCKCHLFCVSNNVSASSQPYFLHRWLPTIT
jgi:hypothetical protein